MLPACGFLFARAPPALCPSRKAVPVVTLACDQLLAGTQNAGNKGALNSTPPAQHIQTNCCTQEPHWSLQDANQTGILPCLQALKTSCPAAQVAPTQLARHKGGTWIGSQGLHWVPWASRGLSKTNTGWLTDWTQSEALCLLTPGHRVWHQVSC